jgi:hypothetical protein
MSAREEKSRVWDRHPDDYYIEEEWCDRRLFEVEKFKGGIFDPACGSGRIVRAAIAAGHVALGHDKVRRSVECTREADFLTSDVWVSNIVSNPPFGIAQEFIEHALEMSQGKTAMLLPLTWLAGDDRAVWLATTPLLRVYVLTPRPSMPPGPVIEAGIKLGGGKKDFCWVVWLRAYDGTPTFHQMRRDG